MREPAEVVSGPTRKMSMASEQKADVEKELTEIRKEDAPSGHNDDAFGQGTKEDTAVPTIVSGSIPPQKSDLTRFYAASEFVQRLPTETPFKTTVRFRTVGDMTCTGAVASNAATLPEVIAEVAAATLTERGATRADDRFSEAAMEDRKREGYF